MESAPKISHTEDEEIVESEPADSKSPETKSEPEKPPSPMSADLKEKLDTGNLKRTTKIPSISSIKGEVADVDNSSVKEIKEDVEPKQERNNSIAVSNLEKAWNEFAAIRKLQGKAQEQHIFMQPYNLEDDGITIKVELNNSLQMDILEEIRSDLVQFLRNKLQNDSIMLATSVKKENGKKMLYTNKEKLDHMAKKNPLVSELQTKLGLDPDF